MKVLRITSTRGFQIGFLLLLSICAAQISWWILDEVRYTSGVRDRRMADYEVDLEAAAALRARGLEQAEILRLFPHLRSGEVDAFELRAEASEALDDEVFSRLNRYGWEGTFFLLVLAAGMVVLYRTLAAQARLRQSQENFLAAVSHELKSPLAGIRLSAETLNLRDPELEKRKSLVQRLLQDVDRLEEMIQNILDARRFDEGQAQTEPQRVELGDAVRRAVTDLAPILEQRRISVSVDVAPDLCVMADPGGVRTAMRNLLDNAAKAVALSQNPQAGSIEVVARRAGSRVQMTVRDDGCGFPPDEAPRLFRKFYRTGSEMTRTRSGAGLGLYLVQRFLALDGATVSAHSEGPGRGAEFRVSWKAAEEES